MAIWIRKAEFQKEDNKWLKGRMDQVKAENEVIDQQIKVLSRDMKRLREDNGKAREKYERAKVRVRAMKESKTTMESRLDILWKATQINQNDAAGFSYVEPPEESYDCSFRTFEVAEVIPKVCIYMCGKSWERMGGYGGRQMLEMSFSCVGKESKQGCEGVSQSPEIVERVVIA
ncbi:hypothetical protein COLO4_27504 [Corchorus olitorius]|uniref:Uncharacterized protein n=1 Tax=Corchorus olitorius TaxID=93759 RepID=A0A1R3HQK3_9ROSI|nr:hypothetical protein COLO4_27504 [Corchorus olitorius]